ncbi:PREDICTED: AIG2-like protein isoform X3 [Populus euphratica]|uniref:Putative gamma-glutamylcyclotransferase n=1 Tax=Populus euphratica TaxID=75702 RepID=A0AAJ6T9E8_POPEU|nr:PREDICTED: AIG2-like protein isoform X3 [Populus euphratica]
MAAAAAGNQVHNVFVYGSLLADDVVRALSSRIPQSSPAILNGYHRFSIKGRVYPAILPVESKKVSGKVCSIPQCFTAFWSVPFVCACAVWLNSINMQ